MIRKILLNNQDSVNSVRGSSDEDTIKENMTEKQDELDLHNDLAPSASSNGVDKFHAKSEEPEDIETEFLEEDLQDDWTESSVSVSEKSANAPIRNKKVPFGLIRKFLKNNQVSVASVRGRDDEDNIKENMTKKQDELDLHNDLAPGAIADEVDISPAESDEPEDIETEVLEEDLKDDLTESSASVREKSAHAPIHNKKITPFKALGLMGMMFGIKKMGLTSSSSDSGSGSESGSDSESEDELHEDWTESSVSISEKSANAPIRNKKIPFRMIRKILLNNQNSVTSVSEDAGKRSRVEASHSSLHSEMDLPRG